MSSRSVPSGSRKYTLVPRPFAPPRVMGPASTSTPRARRCSTAASIAPFHSKQRSLLPGARDPRDHRGPRARTVHVQLLATDAVGNTTVDFDDLSAEHVAVEGVRTFEIADRDNDVVQSHPRTIRARGGLDTRNRFEMERVVRHRRQEDLR